MNNVVSQRFIECFLYLKEKGELKSARQFSLSLDFLPQNFSDIKQGNRDVTIELLRKAIEQYHFNPEYIFYGNGNKILKPEDRDKQLKILTIPVDKDGNERILHVPVPAQAGYASAVSDTEYIDELTTYTLPDYRFKTGTYRSFDVQGDSMEPTFYQGERVICSFVDPSMWRTTIKNGNVYIVVTYTNIVLKRLSIHRYPEVELYSDNEEFDPYRMNLSQIKEIWHVRYKLAAFDHSKHHLRDDQSNEELSKTLEDLRNAIAEIKK